MKHIRMVIPAGVDERFPPGVVLNLEGQTTTFIDENGVRHEATIVTPIHASDKQITITLEIPDEAAIDSMKTPLRAISIQRSEDGNHTWWKEEAADEPRDS